MDDHILIHGRVGRRGNVAAKGPNRFFPLGQGVESMAEMALLPLHPTVSSLSTSFATAAAAVPGFAHVRWDRRQQVRVTTLDKLIAAHEMPRYIKIDVEGFEEDVLKGLGQLVPMLSVEYLPPAEIARSG